ncbi:MAG TPA: MFS transporter [Candidatus Saccharimonadia bacterium]|jgi:MFS family permease
MGHTSLSQHQPHLKYLDHRELGALYWSVFIKGIGDSLISIFTAIYLLEIGFHLPEVAIFYILYFAICALGARFSMHLSQVWGVKKTLGTGTIVFIIYFFLLTRIPVGIPYWLVGIVYGCGASLYWSAFQLDLAAAIRSRTAGQSLSYIQILAISAGIIGPVFGALFIVHWSFAALFILVSAILAASLAPLLKRGDYQMPDEIPSWRSSLTASSPLKALRYGLYGATESAVDILWPVFIYLTYPHLVSIGGIVGLTSLLMLIVSYFAGKWADRSQILVYRTGILTGASTWLFRLLWLTPTGLLIGNFLGTATNSLVALTLDQSMYHDAKAGTSTPAILLFRTGYAAIGRIAVLAIACFINRLEVLFIITAVITLSQIFISTDNKAL